MNRALPAVAMLVVALLTAGIVPTLPVAGADDRADAATGSAAAYPRSPSAAPGTAPTAQLEAPVVTEPNTSNYLAPPGGTITVSAVSAPGLDVGAVVATDAARLAVRFRVGNVLAVYRAAGADATRRAIVRQYFRRVVNATAVLERRERAALAAYNEGELAATGYLRELARIDATADRLLTSLERVERLAHPDYPVRKVDLGAVRIRLQLLRGPVRDRVGAALAGASSPTRVQVETTESAVVLATVRHDGDAPVYLREAYLPGRHDATATDRYDDLAGVLDRLRELYPWVTDERTGLVFDFGPRPARSISATGTYSATYQHLHGRLTVLFDGATDQVFREIQRKELRLVPEGRTVTNSSGGVRLGVERTRPSGPVRVTVITNGTDRTDPVDATVRLGDRRVGRTGPDGTLWTVAPRGSVTVTASVGDRSVTVTRFSVPSRAGNRTERPARFGRP